MSNVVHGITVDFSKDSLFDELGIKRLKESYMKEDENSPQERFAYVSKAFGSNKEHSQRLYEYSSNHWLSYSTPILSFGRSKRGLPISCFLPYLHDSAEGLVDCLAEVNWFVNQQATKICVALIYITASISPMSSCTLLSNQCLTQTSMTHGN